MKIVNFVAALCLSSRVMPAVVASGTYDEVKQRQLKDEPKPNLRGLSWWADGDVDPNAGEGKTMKLVEAVPCEPEHSRAVDFVQAYGDLNAGNAACAAEADPDSCGGGCCRFGAFFICDEENQMAHLPCVCNRNTQDPKDYVAAFAAPASARDGEGTGSSTMEELVGTIVDNNAPESPKSGNESSSTVDSVAAGYEEGGIDVDAGVDDEDAKSPLDAIWDFFFGDDEDAGANSTSASNISTPVSSVSVSKATGSEVASTKPASAGNANASAVASPRSGENALGTITKGVSGAFSSGAKTVTNAVTKVIPRSGENHTETGNSTGDSVAVGDVEGGIDVDAGVDDEDAKSPLDSMFDFFFPASAGNATNASAAASPRTGENPLNTIVKGVSGAVTGGAKAVSSGAKAVTNTVTKAIPKKKKNQTETGNSTVKCGDDDSPKDGESNSTGTGGDDEANANGEGNSTEIDVDVDDEDEDEDEDLTGGNARAPKDGESNSTETGGDDEATTSGEGNATEAKCGKDGESNSTGTGGDDEATASGEGNTTDPESGDNASAPKDGESNSTETGGDDEATTSGEGSATLIDVDDGDEDSTVNSEQPKMGFSMPWNFSMPWDDPESGENATAPKDGESNSTGTGGDDEATTIGEGNSALIDVVVDEEDEEEDPKAGDPLKDIGFTDAGSSGGSDGSNSTDSSEAPKEGSLLDQLAGPFTSPKAGVPVPEEILNATAEEEPKDGSLLDQLAGPFTSPKAGVPVPEEILNATAEEEPSFFDKITDTVTSVIPGLGGNATKVEEEEELELVEEELEAVEKAAEELKELIEAEPAD